MKKFLLITFLFMSLLLVTACGNLIYPMLDNGHNEKTQNNNERLILSGSTSLTKLCNAIGEKFMEKYPNVYVEKLDTGSGAATKDVLSGAASIGNLSRELKDYENPEKFNSIVIAYDGIALILNNSNPIKELKSEDITKIFKGEIKNWNALGGNDDLISLIGREESSGTRDGFESAFNVKGQCVYDVEYPEAGDVLAKVSKDTGAIGYASLFNVSGDVHAIYINGIEPSEQNILDGLYSVSRPFIQIYKKDNDDQNIKNWFNFLASTQGIEIIKREKLIPAVINVM